MKIIRRHMQSITLLFIAGILLVIAFVISQQTRSEDKQPRLTITPSAGQESSGEIPNCAGLTSMEEKIPCYSEAAQVSKALVESSMDELSRMEGDADLRLEMVETQIAWEEWRDAECAFVRSATEDDAEGLLQELMCLSDINLARLARLQRYYNQWYCTEDCEGGGDDGD